MKKLVLSLIAFIGLSAAIVACGSNSGGSNNSAVYTPNGCPTAGYINTAYGCTPPCATNAAYGTYNGACVPPVATGYNGYGSGCYNTGTTVGVGYANGYNAGCTGTTGYGYTGAYPYTGYTGGGYYPYGYSAGYPYYGYTGYPASYGYGIGFWIH